jgi:hypothetical protein
MDPSEAWHVAADAAIGFVATLEGHTLRATEADALTDAGFTTYVDSDGVLRVRKDA